MNNMNKTKYKMQVFEIGLDYQQLTEVKHFNSLSLAKLYMSALRKKHEGDKFSYRIYENA